MTSLLLTTLLLFTSAYAALLQDDGPPNGVVGSNEYYAPRGLIPRLETIDDENQNEVDVEAGEQDEEDTAKGAMTSDDVVAIVKPWEPHWNRRGGNRFGRPEYKHILENLSDASISDFHQIRHSNELNRSEMLEKLRKWAEENEKEEEIESYIEKMSEWRRSQKNRRQKAVDDLAEKFEEIESIRDDDSLTKGEIWKAIAEVAKSSDELTASLIRSLYPRTMKSKKHGRRHHRSARHSQHGHMRDTHHNHHNQQRHHKHW